jgi:hypothetical protein
MPARTPIMRLVNSMRRVMIDPHPQTRFPVSTPAYRPDLMVHVRRTLVVGAM